MFDSLALTLIYSIRIGTEEEVALQMIRIMVYCWLINKMYIHVNRANMVTMMKPQIIEGLKGKKVTTTSTGYHQCACLAEDDHHAICM